MKIRSSAAAVLAVCLLSACTPGMNAAVQSVQSAIRGDTGASSARLNPNFSYLRVTIGGRVAFLALGNVDNGAQGPIEVWYSALREVVRLQNGRIVGIVGFSTEWRNVSVADAPHWSDVALDRQPIRWTRVRDIMPGYRFGVRDELALRVIPPPGRSQLHNIDPHSLKWFEESMASPVERVAFLSPGASRDLLPPARYAVDLAGGRETVVYGEQCIAPDTCFTWQRWSAEQQNKAIKK